MAKARAIVKRRKAVRNIRKITKTMQMIATAKFQKSLKRAVGTKPYTMKVRQLVRDLAKNVGNVDHPLLRMPTDEDRKNLVVLVVITSNRGLAGAYNGGILRTANAFIRQQEADGNRVELHVVGKKGINYFNYQHRPMAGRHDAKDALAYGDIDHVITPLMKRFVDGQVDSVHVAFTNFISTSTQRPEVITMLPLAGVDSAADALAQAMAEKESQMLAGSLDARRSGEGVRAGEHIYDTRTQYEFSPDPQSLLDELLPLTVKTAFFQTFLDATTSEHVARMVAMKSATDNADKMIKSLTMQYNRARQSQITTELSEIMGGVEAMSG